MADKESENDAPEADIREQNYPGLDAAPEADIEDHSNQDVVDNDSAQEQPEDADHLEQEEDWESAEADIPPEGTESDEAELPTDQDNSIEQVEADMVVGANEDNFEKNRSPSPAEADLMVEEMAAQAEQGLSVNNQGLNIHEEKNNNDSRSDSPAEEDRMPVNNTDIAEGHEPENYAENFIKRENVDTDSANVGLENGPQNDTDWESHKPDAAVAGTVENEMPNMGNIKREQNASLQSAVFSNTLNPSYGDLSEFAEPCEPECDWVEQGPAGAESSNHGDANINHSKDIPDGTAANHVSLPENDNEKDSEMFSAIQAGIDEAINKSSSFLDSDPPSPEKNSKEGSPQHQSEHSKESLGLTQTNVSLSKTVKESASSQNVTASLESLEVKAEDGSDTLANVEHSTECDNKMHSTSVKDCQDEIPENVHAGACSSEPSLVRHSDASSDQGNKSLATTSAPNLSTEIQTVSTEISVCSGDRSGNAKNGDVPDEDLLNELDAELDSGKNGGAFVTPNGVCKFSLSGIPEYQQLKALCVQQDGIIKELKNTLDEQSSQLKDVNAERDRLESQLKQLNEKSSDEIYQTLIKELEVKTITLERNLKISRDKLQSHDAAAKRTVGALQTELKNRVEQVTKLYEECKKEKETMTVRYAQAEHKNLEMGGKVNTMEKRMKEIAQEREMMIKRFHELKADKNKAASLFESKNQEMVGLRRELDRLREALSSHEIKVKWAQNKLKAEVDAHKETKGKLEEMQRKFREAKEETETIRADCQTIIKKCQEDEDAKSHALDKQLKEKQEQLANQKQEKNDQEEVYYIVLKELESLKKRHKDAVEENKTWKDKVRAQELERTSQEQHLEKYRETLQNQKSEIAFLHKRVEEQTQLENEAKELKEKWDAMEKRVAEIEASNRDLQSEMKLCANRESENLDFTQKISDKNAKLQSENSTLSTKVTGLTAEVERLSEQVTDLQARNRKLEKDLKEECRLRAEESDGISTKLAEKSKLVEQLTIQVEEERDENRTLKRKHAANTKDLTRQLQQAKKRLEQFETKDSASQGSMGSRTPSNGSLDTMGNHNGPGATNTGPVSRTPVLDSPPQEEYEPVVRVIEVDKQMLVEKIVRLQKAHARKNEKMEFMEDHINQLVEEIRKKNKIIQNYALREEAGTLSPEVSDENKLAHGSSTKAQMAKKGGIMASLYSSHSQDGNMTLDLSLDINRKLQAVLEDTLLKNITLKDNLQTLGEEIARLSQENRKLQLNMQGAKKKH